MSADIDIGCFILYSSRLLYTTLYYVVPVTA